MNRGKKKQSNRRPHSYDTYSREEFLSFKETDSSKLINGLSANIKKFQSTLEHSKICVNDIELVIDLLLIVSHGLSSLDKDMCSKALNILGEAFSRRCCKFQDNLKTFFRKPGIKEKTLNSVCDLFQVLLSKNCSYYWNVLPLDELSQTLNFLAEQKMLQDESSLLSKSQDLLELRKAAKKEEQIKIVQSSCAVTTQKTWDNSEYRDIEILPQWEEISTPKPPYKLRSNIVDGKYEDWMHYYDIQFRLLREDFISPLRKGIQDFLGNKFGRDLRNIKVFSGVKIVKPLFTKAGLCHEIKFDTSHFKHYDWEHSQRLLFGSFLCLIPENFTQGQTVYFAIVSNRDTSKLKRGLLEVMFKGGAELINHKRLKTKFNMVESLAYFEASRHILRSLQKAEVDTMPFTKYLISNDCGVVAYPQYLSHHLSTYNMQCIVKDVVSHSKKYAKVTITNNAQWPSLNMTEFDGSQLQAMKMALTQELSVIQGPPGTGKTYIGLKIVQVLLKNRHVWNSTTGESVLGTRLRPKKVIMAKSPILIMCYTNHALDQFLEEIIEMEKGNPLTLIRIGGRTKKEEIKKHNLREVKRRLRNIPKEACNQVDHSYSKLKKEGAECSRKLSDYKDPTNKFIGFSNIKCIMEEEHVRSLLDSAETEKEQKMALEIWLGLFDKVSFEEYSPVDNATDVNKAGSSEDSNSEDTTSEESSNSDNEEMVETKCTKTIEGVSEAQFEQDSRMIDGVEEMFKQLTFEDVKLDVSQQERRPAYTYDVRRAVDIVPCKKQWQFKKRIMHQKAMPEKKVRSIHNLNSLHMVERSQLYKYWHTKYAKHTLEMLEEDCRRYNEVCEEAEDAKKRTDRYALEAADVIGMTTTGAAKYQHILHMVKPKIVIVEEAAEVLESHIVSALSAGTQHLILIGDHKQLRPKPNEYDLVVKYKFDISLFERLVKNDFPHVTLQIQHRMQPEISKLVRPHIYDTLFDHDSVKCYPEIKGISQNLFFIQHDNLERAGDNLSYSNDHEAEYLAALCKYLLQQGYQPNQITVLVTYMGQFRVMKKSMPLEQFEGVRVSTVDNFQGEENDIILLSLVRSNNIGKIGFLQEENRVCVALSRAKHGFYCIGNFEMLRNNSDIWQKIISDMEINGKVGKGLKIYCNNHPDVQYTAILPQDFAINSPNGGCKLPCDVRLSCGHVCAQKCHINDREHLKYDCSKKCERECSRGHTSCKNLCYQKCACIELFTATAKCGHEMTLPCYLDIDSVKCETQCEKTCRLGHSRLAKCYQSNDDCPVPITRILKCGHSVTLKCSQDCDQYICTEDVLKTLECGHVLSVKCSEYENTNFCHNPCSRKLRCGHPCPSKCGQPCNSKCYEKVTVTPWNCRNKHVIEVMCHEQTKLECPKPCQLTLQCGHKCTGICGGKCTEKCEVNMTKICPQGHKVLRKCFQTFDLYPCTERCKKKLKCGHTYTALCSKSYLNTNCKELVRKSYPCGHQHRIPCSSLIEENPCDFICRAPLACGHLCRGMCSDCFSTRIHKPCTYSVKLKHICGEEIRMACSGLRDATHTKPMKADVSAIRLLHCSHCHTPYSCSNSEHPKCTEPCEWVCPHYKCKKLCYELCERPPCNLRCPLTMQCGHPCIGLCGEPCITVCPDCHKNDFSHLLMDTQPFTEDERYTQLPCGHIYTVREMDQYCREKPEDKVGPFQCPECSSPLSCSYRYGNVVKESLFHVSAAKRRIADLTTEMELTIVKTQQLKRMLACLIESNLVTKRLHSRTLYDIQATLADIHHRPSSEEGFFYFIFITMVKLSSITDRTSAEVFQPMLDYLTKIIRTKQEVSLLSYQLMSDLRSEFFRLCLHSKLNLYIQQSFQTCSSTENFLKHLNINFHQCISQNDFIQYSSSLDKKLMSKQNQYSTTSLLDELANFQPLILSGTWQKCSAVAHYYCIPVCEMGHLKVQCPECMNGTYVKYKLKKRYYAV